MDQPRIHLRVRILPMPRSQAAFLRALRDLLDQHAPALREAGLRIVVENLNTHALNDRAIARIVADYVAIAYDVATDQILQTHGKSRLQKIAEARHVALILTQDFTGLSDRDVAPIFKGDRSIMVYARKCIAGACDVDPAFRTNLATMRAELATIIETAKSQNPPQTFDALAAALKLRAFRVSACKDRNQPRARLNEL
jgi:molybdopterin biosynthesis enzyme MoaB